MTSITCAEVQEQLELYAAGECPAQAQTAIDQHLEHCADCGAALAEAQQLVDNLDLHYQAPAQLQRLQAALAAESRRRPLSRLPILRRAAALAATLLLTLGLARLSQPLAVEEQPAFVPDLMVARAVLAEKGLEAVVPGRNVPSEKIGTLKIEKAPAALVEQYPLDFNGQDPAAVRRQLREFAGTNQLPPPPRVNLELTLHNRSSRTIEVRVGDKESELLLRLHGPGAVSVPAPPTAAAPFLTPRTLILAPGESTSLPLDRLIYGSPGHVWYAYWTEPGTYTLDIQYRTVVAPADPSVAPRKRPERWPQVTLGSASLRIEVLVPGKRGLNKTQ